MSALRKNLNDISYITQYFSGEKMLETIVGNSKYLDITKPAHIIDAIPGKIEYQYGRTFTLWLAAPIPRTMWKEKPVISIGQILGEKVFGSGIGRAGGGIPPGFISELYWNFGVPGVLIGMYILGLWLKFIYVNFRKHFGQNKNILLIYISIMVPFVYLIQNSFTFFIIEAVKFIVPLFITLWFIGQQQRVGN
jgi:hypothetical protein